MGPRQLEAQCESQRNILGGLRRAPTSSHSGVDLAEEQTRDWRRSLTELQRCPAEPALLC